MSLSQERRFQSFITECRVVPEFLHKCRIRLETFSYCSLTSFSVSIIEGHCVLTLQKSLVITMVSFSSSFCTQPVIHWKIFFGGGHWTTVTFLESISVPFLLFFGVPSFTCIVLPVYLLNPGGLSPHLSLDFLTPMEYLIISLLVTQISVSYFVSGNNRTSNEGQTGSGRQVTESQLQQQGRQPKGGRRALCALFPFQLLMHCQCPRKLPRLWPRGREQRAPICKVFGETAEWFLH